MRNKNFFIIFATLFILLILTPIAVNKYYNFLLTAPHNEENYTIFVISPGSTVAQIAEDLKNENLIKNSFSFRLLTRRIGIGKSIQAGDFRLSPHMSAKEIAQELTHGAIDIWITIPEGLRIEEQAEIIEAKLTFANDENYNYDKKEYIKLAEEGYMFPDTYLIPKDADALAVVSLLRSTFDAKVDSLTKDALNLNLTKQEIIILASLIERETLTDEERPIIAGILSNRLKDGIALQVDATVQYAKGYDSASSSWWPQVTIEDTQSVDSLYNTYLQPGLPPKPISSPGLKSIEGAANPQETQYYYYLHDYEGDIHYAKTIEEHNANIQNFL